MNDWCLRTYGDPCRECGFTWAMRPTDAIVYVEQLPGLYSNLIGFSDGRSRHPDLAWTSGEYVCHVVDNLRIWAERLAAAARGSTAPIGAYDSDLLRAARQYDAVPIEGALWSLGPAVDTWRSAVDLARVMSPLLHHPQRGPLEVDDIILSNAHDSHHHAWDIERSIST